MVRHNCAEILKLGNNYQFFRSTANRPNLNYSVKCKPDSKDDVAKDMVAFIKANHVGDAGIIYTFSKKEADTVADQLCNNGIIARSYHSNVREDHKHQILKSWMRNETQVVVATIAFGLGINKPDVRFVLHHSLSKSLEAYYQESGRAGRDGKKANCVLFYSPKDVARMLGMIHGEAGEPNFWAMALYGQVHGDDALCRHVILAMLGEADNTMGDTLYNLQKKCATTVDKQIGAHCQTVTKVVDALNIAGKNCTINQVVSKCKYCLLPLPYFNQVLFLI
jgi:ATP-dependent DNA helicase Q1